jgi:hypothetical protein
MFGSGNSAADALRGQRKNRELRIENAIELLVNLMVGNRCLTRALFSLDAM